MDQENFDEDLREKEIKRLTDSLGSEEPVKGILTDDEILKYAGESKYASEIRLKRGIGTFKDKRKVHDEIEIIWCMFPFPIGIVLGGFALSGILIAQILFVGFIIFFSIYTIYYFYLKDYTKENLDAHENHIEESTKISPGDIPIENNPSLKSFNIYKTQIKDLKNLYDVKEKIAKELIGKRFTPPQITYDKFISAVDNCTDLFNNQVEVISNMINLASEHTPKIDYEIETRINILKSIIEKIDSLTNELVVNIGQSQSEEDETVKNLLEDMENLIGSIKDYN